jgi:hypothetical protein
MLGGCNSLVASNLVEKGANGYLFPVLQYVDSYDCPLTRLARIRGLKCCANGSSFYYSQLDFSHANT